MITRCSIVQSKLKIGSRLPDNVTPPPPPEIQDGWFQDLTMIQVNIIQMDDLPTNSCVISPAAFLFSFLFDYKERGGHQGLDNCRVTELCYT